MRATPRDIGYVVSMAASRPDFMGIMAMLTSTVLDEIPFFPRSTYLNNYEGAVFIVSRQVARKEFRFMSCFTDGVWAAIWASVLLVAAALSLVLLVSRGRLRRTHGGRKVDEFGLGGLVFVQSSASLGRLDRRMRGWRQSFRCRAPLGAWLLAVTVLGFCLLSTMRDLMSAAIELDVPHRPEDLLKPHFAGWSLSSVIDARLDESFVDTLRTEGRLIVNDFLKSVVDPYGSMASFVAAVVAVRKTILLRSVERALLMVPLLVRLGRAPLVEHIRRWLNATETAAASILDTFSAVVREDLVVLRDPQQPAEESSTCRSP
jgi:hypothetical protein